MSIRFQVAQWAKIGKKLRFIEATLFAQRQKTLNLALEVIVQPPIHTFLLLVLYYIAEL